MTVRWLIVGVATPTLAGCGARTDFTAPRATSAPSEVAAPPTSSAVKSFPSKSYTGTGDDAVDIGQFTDLAVLGFQCSSCEGNTVLKSDGGESLLVNTIGPYAETHLINVGDNSMTTRLTVNATGSWLITINDTTGISQATSGTGDAAILVAGPGDEASIRNSGDGNFVVQEYGANSDLLVNEISRYSGTVPISPPAFVQVTSTGSWSIDVS